MARISSDLLIPYFVQLVEGCYNHLILTHNLSYFSFTYPNILVHYQTYLHQVSYRL